MKLLRLVRFAILGCEKESKFRLTITRIMSTKSDALDKSAENWFNRYQKFDVPVNVFQGFSDRFNGVTVDSQSVSTKNLDFAEKLKSSLDYWTANNKRGIWFKVHLQESDWVPTLAKNGFKYHHARDNFVMMYKWLPVEEANIPPYAHTMLGVGAIVINSQNQILVVSEKNALVPNSWKLPGGYAEPKEDLPDAAVREVEEETNIKTKFESVVSIRHAHGAGFGCSDIYCVMAMSPASDDCEIKKCEREIADCKWMDMDEFLSNPAVHETNRNFLRSYLHQKKNNIKVACQEEFHPILKRKYQIFSVASTLPSSL